MRLGDIKILKRCWVLSWLDCEQTGAGMMAAKAGEPHVSFDPEGGVRVLDSDKFNKSQVMATDARIASHVVYIYFKLGLCPYVYTAYR